MLARFVTRMAAPLAANMNMPERQALSVQLSFTNNGTYRKKASTAYLGEALSLRSDRSARRAALSAWGKSADTVCAACRIGASDCRAVHCPRGEKSAETVSPTCRIGASDCRSMHDRVTPRPSGACAKGLSSAFRPPHSVACRSATRPCASRPSGSFPSHA